MKRDYTDAEFATVWPGHRFGFWPVFWWCVYTGAFATVAYQTRDKGEVIVYVIGAALIVPGMRLWRAFWWGLRERVSDQEAQTLRRRLLTREATRWGFAGWRRGRRG